MVRNGTSIVDQIYAIAREFQQDFQFKIIQNEDRSINFLTNKQLSENVRQEICHRIRDWLGNVACHIEFRETIHDLGTKNLVVRQKSTLAQ
jgi:hypothetical protein